MRPSEESAVPAENPDASWSRRLPTVEATRAVGLAIGHALCAVVRAVPVSDVSQGREPGLVLLEGELGSGKTTLVKAACEALGIPPAVVISPTYTLVNVYPGDPPVYHVDLFRLERPEALLELDEHDWINPNGPTFIEWPAIAAPLLTERRVLRVRLFHDGNARRIRVVANGAAESVYSQVLAALAALPEFI